MTRNAHCQCGALKLSVEGDHEAVVACSCLDCQRRTGSVLAVGVYYRKTQVAITGEAREHVRPADSGNQFHTFFCPTCGTSLYFYSDRDPNRIGVAVGAFADPDFPAPVRSVFDQSKHKWITFGADVPGFARGRDSERTR